MDRRWRPWRAVAAAVAAASVGVAACSTDHGVSTMRAAESDGDPTPPTDSTGATTPSTEVPIETAPGRTTELLNFGDDKPARDYDDYLAAALNDIEVWWSEQYPALYGGEFQPLEGGVWAGYPERQDSLPGCGGAAETPYEELIYYAAFYCPDGDFIVYDDGEAGLLYQLTDSLGPGVMGVVLAHEYAHAVQQRAGVFVDEPATIYPEQQADCFSGAWAAHVMRNEAPGLTFSDDDVRAGLVALIQVRDPLGTSALDEGSHGSGFDRVGAFQTGFNEGAARCADLIDEPLTLMPNDYLTTGSSGNAPFGYGDREIVGFAVAALNRWWTAAIPGFTALELVAFQDPEEIDCEDIVGDPDVGALFCPAQNRVYLDDPLARQRYQDYGDFAVGYMLSSAWSEAAQTALGSPLEGEDRALLNDCLTGAWTSRLVPDENGVSQDGDTIIEAGDLDEAIQTALVVGDASSDEDVVGSAFEKIGAFRRGVLGGVPACQDQLAGD